MDDFPGNNPQKQQRQAKKIEPVITSGVQVRKKPVGKKFAESFFEGTVKEAGSNALWNVLIPRFRDVLRDASLFTLDSFIYGSNARTFTTNNPQNQAGRVNYGGAFKGSQQVNPKPTMSPQARARHDFDELMFDSRDKAQRVLDGLIVQIESYGLATVSDFYDLCGITVDTTTEKWGWSNLQNAGIANIGGAYILNLPKPEPIK